MEKIQNKYIIFGVVAAAALVIPGTLGPMGLIQQAEAKQSCNQGPKEGLVVNACVNANVEKNNICVGVLQETARCQTN